MAILARAESVLTAPLPAASVLVRKTGFGNAAGLLASLGLLASGDGGLRPLSPGQDDTNSR
jgi:hypothetical protein